MRQLPVEAQTEPLWLIGTVTVALLAATSGLVHGLAWYLTAVRRSLESWASIVICASQLLVITIGLVRGYILLLGP